MRAERENAARRVGLRRQRRAQREVAVADADRIAALQAEPRDQIGRGHRAPDAVALRQRGGERHRRIERDRAVKRIGAIDRAQFDQRRPGCRRRCAPSRASRRRATTAPLSAQEGKFADRSRCDGRDAIRYRRRAARAHCAEPRRDRGGERADAGDDRDAERETGEENPEAAQAAAQFAQRPAQRQRAHAICPVRHLRRCGRSVRPARGHG